MTVRTNGILPTITRKIPIINGLRGIAALAIIYQHIVRMRTGPGWHAVYAGDIPLLPYTFLSNGFQGVALFFFLSGFVLFLPYAEQRRSMQSIQDALAFYGRRARRLLPLYWFSILTSLLFLHPPESVRTLLKELFLLGTFTFTFFTEHFYPRVNGILWTLSVEAWFALLLPVLIWLMYRSSVLRVCMGMLLVALLTRFLGAANPQLTMDNALNILADSLPGRLDDFAAGMAVAWLYTHKALPKTWWTLPGSAVLLLLGFWLRDYCRMGILSVWWQPFSPLLVNGGFILLTSFLLTRTKGFFHAVFSNSALQLTGLMCYSLYVWHGLAIDPLHARDSLPNFLLYFVLLFVFSFLSYRYIEFRHVQNVRELLPSNEK